MRAWSGGREEYPWLMALIGMTIVSVVAAGIAGAIAGIPAHSVSRQNVMTIMAMTPISLFVVVIVLTTRAAMLQIPNPIGKALAFVRGHARSPAAVAACLLPILVLPWLMGSFGTLKMLMPRVVDFTWDDQFAAIDRILFLGRHPWEISHFLMGNAVVTRIVDFIYSMWVALLFFAVLVYALFAPRYDRARFFLAFGASWLLIGVVGAYVFASAGPCFTAQIGASSAPEFASLMERLRTIDSQSLVGAVRWQDKLWTHHSTGHYALGMGISAMPSMHNAITWLYALTLKRAPLPYRVAAWAFVAVIFLGSIHLGWHYAVDGLVAFAMMSGIWWGAGAFLEKTATADALRGSGATAAADTGSPSGLLAA